jgi:hypothetical protein
VTGHPDRGQLFGTDGHDYWREVALELLAPADGPLMPCGAPLTLYGRVVATCELLASHGPETPHADLDDRYRWTDAGTEPIAAGQ